VRVCLSASSRRARPSAKAAIGGPAHDPAVHELTLDWLERVLASA
jgi:hypothetical protein